MEPAAVTMEPKTPVQHAQEGRCSQCGEKLVSQRTGEVLPARRTSVEICNDCSAHGLPHTD
jgi:formylmethanofuran dehydrogenase subunit E